MAVEAEAVGIPVGEVIAGIEQLAGGTAAVTWALVRDIPFRSRVA